MPETPPDEIRQRGLWLLGAVVLAVAAIGFVTGISPDEYEARRSKPLRVAVAGDVPPARTHAELERRPWGTGPRASGWSRAVDIAADASTRLDGQSEGVSERAWRRAYDGAPPVVPHPIRSGSAPECLACHSESFELAGRRAGDLPHTPYASCTQCHVPAAPSLPNPADDGPDVASSRWQGLGPPGAGAVAYAGAPPAVPHTTWMRDRCDSCHGAAGSAALQTPHPERRSCLQCHPAHSPTGPPGAR